MNEDENSASGADAAVVEETFGLLGNRTRANILKTLGDARADDEAPPILSFSELRARVSDDINSSQFNYHLQQLVDRFVEHTGNGYRMRPEGMLLYRTINAGTFTDEGSLSPFEIGVDCYRCAGAIEGSYDASLFELECDDCGTFYDMVFAPPGTVVDGETAALLDRLDQYSRHRRLAFVRGVCPTCMNGLEPEVVAVDEPPFDEAHLVDRYVHWTCDRCGDRMYVTVGMAMVQHPAVISFFHDHGVNIAERRLWELEFAMTDRYATVRSTDPWTVALEIPCADEVLELVVDDRLTVLERTRR